MKKIRTFLYCSFVFSIILSLFVLGINLWVTKEAKYKAFDDVAFIPFKKVGVVLGTSKNSSSGPENLFFNYRIQAAVKLYNAGKVEYILVSGDNRHKNYNEPLLMRIDLIKSGIPKEKIIMDFAGFRTLDSVIRANKVFGLNDFTIISQKFHNERALFIARRKGINAIAFNAQDPPMDYMMNYVLKREKLARCLMILDLLFFKQAKFLGDPVVI